MAFVQKTWTNRIAEFINRRVLTKEDGATELVTVARSEGQISQEGDAFNADNMNDLEQRIADEFAAQNETFAKQISELNTNLTQLVEKHTYSERIALAVIPATGTYSIDFTKYKKIVVYLTAANMYGATSVFDTDWITNDVITGLQNTIQTGLEESTYYATASFVFNTSGINITVLTSPQANCNLSIYGLK